MISCDSNMRASRVLGLDLILAEGHAHPTRRRIAMQFGRLVRSSFALLLAIAVASTTHAQQAPPAGQAPQSPAGAGAQGRGGDGRGGGAPYTPAAGAKDLRAVLFNWMWHQGMLKGTDERDMVATLEYQAKGGTIQVDG